MRCPLCGGPVHEEDGSLMCEVGHKVQAPEVLRATELRLAEALWMAMEALQNEAAALRALKVEDWEREAEAAEEQATLLWNFARTHASQAQG